MRVFITGCSRGIGRAVAQKFAQRGHHVVATARQATALESLTGMERIVLDVTKGEKIAEVAARIGPIDVLVNAAGGPLVACSVENQPLEDVRTLLEVNVFGAWSLIQAFLPSMRERRHGTIVNVSSVIGRAARPLRAAQSATKFALEAISEALKYETEHFGIRVILVQPGATLKDPGSQVSSLIERSPAYRELFKQVEAADQRLSATSSPQTPEAVAVAIADAVENEAPPFRLPVGKDASLVLSSRASNDDVRFEAQMRSLLGITW